MSVASESIQNLGEPETFDAVIVGAGVGGLYSLYKLREMGFTVRVIEQASGVGGTWFWNRYPGCRCDVESYQYSYSFSEELQREWTWSERFASQPEILAYLNHVADRFDLRRDITFNTAVTAATYQEDSGRWLIQTDSGAKILARFCIMATGCLSVPRTDLFKNQDQFAGEVYYTALWPEEGVDVTGKRVGVVGTSASGTQSIPLLAKQAEHLYVFQRTPNFSVPSRNGPTDPAVDAQWKANYPELRKTQWNQRSAIIFELPDKAASEVSESERRETYEKRWEKGGLGFMRAFTDLFVDRAANDTAADFVRSKIAETVRNPKVAEKLMPTDHAIGTRRICTDNGYYETYNRDNVTLVDVRGDPIVEATPTGLRTRDASYDFDVLVLATGFDSVIGALFKINIRGRGGVLLRDKWRDGPIAHMGMAVAGFPNLFYQTGPLSPGTLASMIQGNEVQTNWIAQLLDYAREHHIHEIEATEDAERAWTENCDTAASKVLHYTAPESSYIFKCADGTRKFMIYIEGFDAYRERLDACAANGYDGFVLHGGDVEASHAKSAPAGA
jgi:cyclohexanone monooxygenase